MDSFSFSDSEMQSQYSDSPVVQSASRFPSNTPSPKKWLAPMLLLVLFLIGFFFIISQLNKNKTQELRTSAAGTDVGVVLSSSPTTVAANSTINTWVDVTLPTGTTNKLSAVDIYITYPSALLSVVSVQPGPLFVQNHDATTEMLNIVKTDVPGEVRIVLGSPCKKDPPYSAASCTKISSTTRAATIQFRALAAGTATVSVSTTKTQIASIDSAGTVFNSVASSNALTIQSTQSNKRDVSGATLGKSDGQVNGRDLSYILQFPFPCGGSFGACPATEAGLASRDVSGSVTLGTPDGLVNARDLSFILQSPFPCGGVGQQACQ